MQNFSYEKTANASAAIHAIAKEKPLHQGADVVREPHFIAGGTNLIDYMSLNVMQPSLLVDINPLEDDSYGAIEVSQKELRLGALVRMSQLEDHAVVNRDYPVIRDSLAMAASRQIRNMASLGGNILQRTRCQYFREPSWQCNKRNPGSGCAALDGINRQHAVLGTSEHCIATYAGDFAQALIALDATINVMGTYGSRKIAFAELHRQPGNTPHIETVLKVGELITHIAVPAGPWTQRSCYVKVRDRQSYQFALVSAAVALHLDGDVVREARVALGGVATVPWRAREAEAALRNNVLDERLATHAAEVAFANAHPYAHNAFKIPIGKQAIVRALLQAKAMEI